jgi:hypothetical protein
MAKGAFESGFFDRKLTYLLFADKKRGPGTRDEPKRIRFGVEANVEPSPAPPVRIYLGTEDAQGRAERVFLWSILQVRDPARVYEIYLLKDLKNFDRSDWKTGFSRYRFAIPAFAGRTGRAIYNDVDQIYLADPAELFDLEMGDRAYLSITRRETSVMLLDCEKLGPLWTYEDALVHKKKHFRAAAEQLWGPLDPAWNARDWEYEPGKSKLLHYSTLHTQPWRPFPKMLRYRDNPDGEVWFALERSAEAASFSALAAAEQPGG